MRTRMRFDDVAWERSEAIADGWIDELFSDQKILRAIGDFIVKHRKGVPTELCNPKSGSSNLPFRMKFEDGGSAIIRFPKPGATMFPEEKVRNEVAVIKYIQENISIPVPFILHWGPREESPLRLGPFIIMEYISHDTDLATALNTPGFSGEDRTRLNPDIDLDKLEMLYGQVADILLQLSKLTFPAIGSTKQIDEFTWKVTRRPLTLNMNELVRLGTFSRAKLLSTDTTFSTASSYFESLAELHIDHLTHQRNDAIDSADDCRRKFVSRHLFHKLSMEGKFTSSLNNNGPFSLWCDDFRPGNVLLNEDLQIVGVVDWEFTYAAPSEFSFAPPWWLLLEQPEYWPGGLESWTDVYEICLQTFLEVLIDREDAAIGSGRLRQYQRLSGRMRESWDPGDSWISYAARKNFAFDAVFWNKLDSRFFGPGANTDGDDRWKERVDLLDIREKEYMEPFVTKKLEEIKERVLAWEPDE